MKNRFYSVATPIATVGLVVGVLMLLAGVDRTIEVIIDPSIDPGSVAKEVAESAETIENSKDVNELQGAALLARELGAKVIGEYPSK